jgi:hypothetical protein
VPPSTTPPGPKPTTGSLNVTVKSRGETLAGSGCPPAWLIVTLGATVSITIAFRLAMFWPGGIVSAQSLAEASRRVPAESVRGLLALRSGEFCPAATT